MPSPSLWHLAGRMLLAHKAGYVLPLLVVMTSCATFDHRAGFSDVSATVEARSGIRVGWNLGTELDAQAAQETDALLQSALTVDGAVQMALLNNRELQAMYADLGVAQADLVQAGLLRNPIFDGAVRFLIGGGSPELELNAAMDFLHIF
jgi:outer membrane protein, heavy metal efflux system